jgi:TonB family protein
LSLTDDLLPPPHRATLVKGFTEAAMKLATTVFLLALATVAAAAESPPDPRSVTGAGYAFRPDPADYYPAESRELMEEGLTRLNLCYDVQGVPVEVAVDKGSGSARLDEAALSYGKAVRIRPGRIDGQPLSGCVKVPVRFSFKTAQESPEQGERKPPPVQVPPIRIDIPPPPPPIDLIPIPLAPTPPPRSIPL